MEKALKVSEFGQGLFCDAECDDGGDVVFVTAIQPLADESASVEDASCGEHERLGALHLDEGSGVVVNGGEDVKDDPLFALDVAEQLGRVEHHAGGPL